MRPLPPEVGFFDLFEIFTQINSDDHDQKSNTKFRITDTIEIFFIYLIKDKLL